MGSWRGLCARCNERTVWRANVCRKCDKGLAARGLPPVLAVKGGPGRSVAVHPAPRHLRGEAQQ